MQNSMRRNLILSAMLLFITSTASCSKEDLVGFFSMGQLRDLPETYTERAENIYATQTQVAAIQTQVAATQAQIAATQAQIQTVEAFGIFYDATANAQTATAQVQTVEAFGTFYVATANAQTATAAPQSTQCDLFKGAEFSHVYGPWLPGAPLPVNIKMPASVAWQELDYNMKIGEVETEDCAPLEGNNTRLSCIITLPPEYIGANNYVLALHIDGCNEPIYTVGENGPLYLPIKPTPVPEATPVEVNACDPYTHDQYVCEAAGGIWDPAYSTCTCPIP